MYLLYSIFKTCLKSPSSALLDTYHDAIYLKHLQIDEMAARDTTATTETLGQVKEKTKNDIKHLIELDLLNGVKYNEENNTLIYFSGSPHIF